MDRLDVDPSVVIAVVGPTATGKSDLALDIADAVGGEVVNADASQLYRGMDIGTAKVPTSQRRGITHHLLDVLDVRETARVGAYQSHVRAVFAQLSARGRVPVLVGGSGLYVRAALDELAFPATDPAVRVRLEAQAQAEGLAATHARLAALDPVAAARLAPSDVRRVVRALEVVEVTGALFSATMPQRRYAVRAVQVGLVRDRDVLRARIAERVAAMVDAGLVEEVQSLVGRGLREGVTASRALGYAQVLAALDGRCTFSEAIEQTVTATRRYARRQLSWFRRDERVRWIDVDDAGGDLLRQALACVAAPPPA